MSRRTSEDPLHPATVLRERHHAEGNRFGQMALHHTKEATFLLGADAAHHLALADKWRLGQHLEYVAAGMISDAFGISEYRRAWDEGLMPNDLEKIATRAIRDGKSEA